MLGPEYMNMYQSAFIGFDYHCYKCYTSCPVGKKTAGSLLALETLPGRAWTIGRRGACRLHALFMRFEYCRDMPLRAGPVRGKGEGPIHITLQPSPAHARTTGGA
jgi:hypothetical protein